MTWIVVPLDARVEAEIEAQPLDIRAKLARISALIEVKGLERVHEPYVQHLQGKLWKMRMIGRDGIARAIYVAATNRRVVILRVFTKKTQRTPRREIEIALARAEEVE